MVLFSPITTCIFLAALSLAANQPVQDAVGKIPRPECIRVSELPLPPVAPSTVAGACNKTINMRRTGCIGQTTELRNGNFLPDNKHIVATVNFTGAPASPDPASIYSGVQLIVIKTDNTKFPNGDPWKCITCGVSALNRNGSADLLEYPQAFRDGQRVLVGNNIVDGGALLSSAECTAATTHVYPIRWSTSKNDTGSGGTIRELRIHPDNVHLGFNSYVISGNSLGQFGYFGRLAFNPSPQTGLPLVPRYDLVNVTRLYNPAGSHPITVEQGIMNINRSAISVGELRGFSGKGTEATFVGSSWESSNIDLFAVHLTTGYVRRITQHPGYADPIDIVADDQWNVILDTRSTNRTTFMAGMRHVPPITDLVTSTIAASIRNNGQRRFFQPWLLDHAGDRGTYFGQQINGVGDGTPGSVNDPMWNAQADPRWSWDGIQIAYYQTLTVSPQCGGINPLSCPVSTAEGGRIYRIMLATLTQRQPLQPAVVPSIADEVPWGVPYKPGDPAPKLPYPAAGSWTLYGQHSGFANVTLTENGDKSGLQTVAVTYHGFSDTADVVIEGNENVTVVPLSLTLQKADWFSNLTSIGTSQSTKITGPGGFHLLLDVMETTFDANGTLTTTIDGVEYTQPFNYT